ncbi:MAG: hypothetical protein ACOYMB_04285 [Patescibacteria group bacterium]
MEKTVSFYEQGLLDLCKKARVKSPLDLVDKKIAFCYSSRGVEVKVYAKVSRIVMSDDKKDGFVSILLVSGKEDFNDLYALNYNSNKNWEYCHYKENKIEETFSIEAMIFRLKWWQA